MHRVVDTEGKAIQKRPLATPLELLIIALLLINAVGLIVTFGQNQRIAQGQDDSTIRGYKNRAVICDMIKGIGIAEPTGCAEAAIRPYRDPRVLAASTAGATASKQTLAVLCWVLQQSSKQPTSTLVLPPSLCKE